MNMSKSRVDPDGTIIWGYIGKVAVALLIAFILGGIGLVTSVAVLTSQTQELKFDQKVIREEIKEDIQEIRQALQMSGSDRYTGTQASADRIAASAERAATRERVAAQEQLVTELRILTGTFQQMLTEHNRRIAEIEQRTKELERQIRGAP